MIDEDIHNFCGEYLRRVAAAVEGGDLVALSRWCHRLSRALRGSGRLFAMGNGGSSAIARAALAQMRLRAGAAGLTASITAVGDQHEVTHWTCTSGHRDGLRDMLAHQGLSSGDTVLAVSISGRSSNILAAAALCRDRGARMLALAGADGAELARAVEICVCAGVADQQVSEDVVLVWLRVLVDAAVSGRCGPEEIATGIRRAVETIRRLAGLPDVAVFLRGLTGDLARAVRQRRAVYVVCRDGGALGLLAEHAAHNVAWDVSASAGVPAPLVLGPASVADLTAIHNDHADPGHGVRHLLDSATAGDIVLGLSHSTGAVPLGALLEQPARRGARVYLLASTVHDSGGLAGELRVAAGDAGELATLAQPVMHMLCRLVSQHLTDAQQNVTGSSLDELLTVDLCARRRRLAATGQVS